MAAIISPSLRRSLSLPVLLQNSQCLEHLKHIHLFGTWGLYRHSNTQCQRSTTAGLEVETESFNFLPSVIQFPVALGLVPGQPRDSVGLVLALVGHRLVFVSACR